MTPEDLTAIIARGEDSRHQFKRDFANSESLAAELAAFANMGGGLLLVGVSDDRRGNQFRVIIWRPDVQLEGAMTPQVAPQVTPQVLALLQVATREMSRQEMMDSLDLKDRKHFSDSYLQPALNAELIEMTLPDKPSSSKQQYRFTEKGRGVTTGHRP